MFCTVRFVVPEVDYLFLILLFFCFLCVILSSVLSAGDSYDKRGEGRSIV